MKRTLLASSVLLCAASLVIGMGIQVAGATATSTDENASGTDAATETVQDVSGSVPEVNASGTDAPLLGASLLLVPPPDTTRPTLVYNEPASSTIASTTLPVSVTASDAGSGIATVAVHVYNASGTFLGSCGTDVSGLGGVPSYTLACTLDVSAYADGNYTLRSGAFDVAGNNVTVSLPFIVEHEVAGPSVPTLLWPMDGTTIPTNVFTFRWNPSTSTVPGPITYQFHSSLNPAETGGVLTTGLWTSPTLTTSSILSTGAPDGTWYWQVRALDAASNTSAWSDIWAVTLNTVPPPALATCPAGTAASLVETDTVNANSATPTIGANDLSASTTYLLVATGTWQNDSMNAADAAYASVDNWTTYMQGYDIPPYHLGTGEFQLQVDGAFVNWGAYQPSHEYAYLYTGTGNPVSLMVFDGDATNASSATPNVSWYGDNSGNLSVSVYACTAAAPATYVITDPATDVTANDATLNGTNGDFDAVGHSFWVATSTFATSSPMIPAGVFSTPDLGAIASGTPFSVELSSLTTDAVVQGQVSGTMPAVTTSTTYYYVAWSDVGGTWYPGAMESFTTGGGSASNTPAATSTLIVKVLVNNFGGGSATSSDFTVKVNAHHPSDAMFPGSAAGTAVTIDPDTNYSVQIIGSHPHYDQHLSSACHDPHGIPAGGSATCTITETYKPFGGPFSLNGPTVAVAGGPSIPVPNVITAGEPSVGGDGGIVLGASVSGSDALTAQLEALMQKYLTLLQQYAALLQQSHQ